MIDLRSLSSLGFAARTCAASTLCFLRDVSLWRCVLILTDASLCNRSFRTLKWHFLQSVVRIVELLNLITHCSCAFRPSYCISLLNDRTSYIGLASNIHFAIGNETLLGFIFVIKQETTICLTVLSEFRIGLWLSISHPHYSLGFGTRSEYTRGLCLLYRCWDSRLRTNIIACIGNSKRVVIVSIFFSLRIISTVVSVYVNVDVLF